MSNWTLVRRVVSSPLLAIVCVMIVLVVVLRWLLSMFERKVNESISGRRRRHGNRDGRLVVHHYVLGHKGVTPVSASGRTLAACAVLLSIRLLSLLTGVIASVLAVQQLDTEIDHPSDLSNVRVVAAGSTSADNLRHRRVAFQTRTAAERDASKHNCC